MTLNLIKYKGWNLLGTSEVEVRSLFDAVKAKDYQAVKVLKEHHRSQVLHIDIMGFNAVIKVPKEANSRKWIRTISILRDSESFKNLKDMVTLSNLGINTTEPIMAAEKRVGGMVVDSWVMYHYLDAEECIGNRQSYPAVVKTLSEIHDKGYLHGDPQIRNFLYKAGEIYVIDVHLARSGVFRKNEEAYEWAYLKKSDPAIEQYFKEIKNSRWYTLAQKYDRFDRNLASLRRSIKRIIGLK